MADLDSELACVRALTFVRVCVCTCVHVYMCRAGKLEHLQQPIEMKV